METGIATAAASAAIVSVVFIWLQVREMKEQTRLQREIAESSAQPYVWADVRVSSDDGWDLNFVLGNSGPTVAQNVRVQIEPPLPFDKRSAQFIERLGPKLERGLASVAPMKELAWPLGSSPELVNREGSLTHVVRIEYDGPYGPAPPTEFVINLDDIRESTARHFGTLHEIRESVDRLAKKMPRK